MNSVSAALKTGAAAALLAAAGIVPALAGGYTTSVTDTVKLDVQGAGYSQTRTGSSYSVGGNNVGSGMLGGLGVTAGTATAYTTGAAAIRTSAAPTIVTAGSSFSYSESAYVGDGVGTPDYAATAATAVPVKSDVTGTIAPNSDFGQVTTSTGGVAGTLAGTLTTGTVPTGTVGTVTAGGAGTSATLQRSIELTIFQ